jgi:proline iminopeptidase
MRAAVRGTELYFDVEGAGLVADGDTMRERPVALVLHGGPGGDHTGFKPSMSPLAAHMQLIYIDHRGHGRSAADDPARYTLDENVEDLEALRRYLGLGPVVVIGTSYGGMVAMAHAARYPASVSKLALIVTAAEGGFRESAQSWVEANGTPDQRRVCAKLWAGRLDTPADMMEYYEVMGPLYARRYTPGGAAATRGRASYTPAAINNAFKPDGFLARMDLRPELAEITAPTLILAGRHDWICPPRYSEEIHRLIPGSTLRVFENSSHSIRVDEPEALNQSLIGFIAEPTDGA